MANLVSTPNKSNHIYNVIRDEIISGKYPGGTLIIEKNICERFSVSRTPVREALIRLAQDQFVNLIPNHSVVVPPITIADIVEILQLRTVNEGLAAALIAKNHTDDVLSLMEQSVSREAQLLASENKNPVEISRADFYFHNLLATHCSNTRLKRTLELIDNQAHRFSRIFADTRAVRDTLSVSLNYHIQAMEAIQIGDSEAARRIMEEHWQTMINGYIKRSLDGELPLSL